MKHLTPFQSRIKIIKEMLSTFILLTAGLLLVYGLITSGFIIYNTIIR